MSTEENMILNWVTKSVCRFSGLIAIFTIVSLAQDGPPKSLTRAECTRIISEARRIVNPDGIQRLEKVHIGGIDQWVSIRGRDRKNPVLLYIHGGPGYVSIPMSWWFSRGWEEYFTVVQWDQRASGKTYLLRDSKDIPSTLTTERMISDVEEMTVWTRRELGKDKIFILGHSYGSFLGLQLAHHHPEWVHAYIGVGQSVDGRENERRGWRFAIEAARTAGNSDAVRELEAIAPYATENHIPINNLYVQRKWVGYYGGVMAYRTDNSAESNLAQLSPDYDDREISHIWDGNKFATPYLLPDLVETDLTGIKKLDIPVILFEGRHDMNVNSQLAAAWLDVVKAPEKHLVWFERSGHMPMTEEPGKFLISLVRYALPIADRAGDISSQRNQRETSH